ncbi:MAG: hypothetical protein ACK4RK_09295 [Gemmataceae bacterium]
MLTGRRMLLKSLLAGLGAVWLPLPAMAQGPSVEIVLGKRSAQSSPRICGCAKHGGGNIKVEHPSPDTVVVTMTGVAVAYCTPTRCCSSGYDANLTQCFTIKFNDDTVKKAKLLLEGRVVGVLRSHCKGNGSASLNTATASVGCDHGGDLLSICLPAHSACGGKNFSINDQDGPYCLPVLEGCYTLNQCFSICASAPRCLLPCKAPSAEFAPNALDPLWISPKDPFYGASKEEFGFQITLKVVPDDDKNDYMPAAPSAEPILPPKVINDMGY